MLSESKGNILEDESAINILGESKTISNEIAAKQEIASVTEVKIDEARVTYIPVAFKASVMFFCTRGRLTWRNVIAMSGSFVIKTLTLCSSTFVDVCETGATDYVC